MHGIEFQLEFLIELLGVVALLAQLARMVGVPYPIFLVLGGIGVGHEYQESSDAWSSWRSELFDAEREAIVSLRDAGEINADVMRPGERDINLKELRQSG